MNCGNRIFKNFYFVEQKNIFKRNFFKQFLYNPKKLCYSIVLNTKNEIYMKVWQS